MTTGTPESAHVVTVQGDTRHDRLHHALAWVGIVAGIVFTVAVIFFSGFALGRASGGYHGWQRYAGPQGGYGCPMMQSGMQGGTRGGMMGPGGMMNPDDMGPGMMRPSASPAPPPAPPPAPSPQRPS